VKTSALVLAAALSAVPLGADEVHRHGGVPPERLGTVRFPVSCSPDAQTRFNRATALLHSFWYDEAAKAYAAVLEADPDCGMAWWGVAMSRYHPIWAPPSPDALAAGRAAVEKAKAAAPRMTERERAYVATVAAYFDDSGTLDHGTRALRFERALQRVFERFPDDHEAAVFYALALNGTAPATDKTYAKQRRAAEILNAVLPLEPDHPGVAHLIIHSDDYPELASLALPAARAYARIALSAPHALHMPSHIFTRLGLWDESIASNIASAAAGKEYAERTLPGGHDFDELHALDYLEYAYLQKGDYGKAKAVLDEVRAADVVDEQSFHVAYTYAAVPARYTLERRDWAGAASLRVEHPRFPWARYRWAEAITHFACAMGAARSGKLAEARKSLAELEKIHAELRPQPGAYDWAGQVEIQRRAAAGWIARAEKRDDEAVALLRSAADLEDSTDKHPVTPGPVLPAREQLGDLLLELSRPQEALAAYEVSNRTAPNRRNGVAGAGRARAALEGR
jgi:tetratricopeptide (TPR) repeat protein